MELAAKLDDIGKPAWIVLAILGFMLWWPVGIGVLAYLIWSGRMACWKQERRRRRDERGGRTEGGWSGWRNGQRSSGNSAFDEYREETLRRLEEEQRDFEQFLERLRVAKDKAEFDQFLAERRSRGGAAEGQAQA